MDRGSIFSMEYGPISLWNMDPGVHILLHNMDPFSTGVYILSNSVTKTVQLVSL